ncbi:hypothetical protein HHL08_00830 [Sphingobium sp. AR-3-1]|uniref:Exo-alpha-sialidase n=2 Tax=Sphingobium psychrophilum TaxID=2728834 RepID=A0A7X9WRR8_9SPHN|nr:hypothetical protein [Sphingobium psychrophilum]
MLPRTDQWIFRVAWAAILFVAGCGAVAQQPPTLDDFWADKAHFVETRKVDWSKLPGGDYAETSSWFAIDGGTWYAFNRAGVPQRNPACPTDNMQTVVRASSDEGATWTPPTVVAAPGDSKRGDGCAILDGASIYDAASDTWHMLAQCLELHNAGSWMLCHYTRQGRSPLGRFVADPLNPVVKAGMLWSSMCADKPGICDPSGTQFEGTPDIVRNANGLFYVTFHGYELKSGRGVRGIATTKDFQKWNTRGGDLPQGAMLGPDDCRRWISACVGVGTATVLSTKRNSYFLFEAMDQNLGCTPGQNWVFSIARSPRDTWLPSGSPRWEFQKGPPLITPSAYAKGLPCAVQYARWFQSRGTTWLIYEERQPESLFLVRRLMKLVWGNSGERMVIKGRQP